MTSLDLTASNLEFDAVSTGVNRIGLSPHEPSRGFVNVTTGQVSLDVALAVTNAFLPDGVLFMNVAVSGEVRMVGTDTVLELSASGPAANAFPSDTTPPPTEVIAVVGASGGTLSLGEGTDLVIPQGALSAPTEIGLFMTAAILAETAVPAGFDRVAVTREVLPVNQAFDRAVTMSIAYDLGDIAGLDESSLRAVVFDAAAQTWTLIADSAVDVSGDVVTFRLSNFESGYFGIGGRRISGDLDGDGDVDRSDLASILGALNTAPTGPDDPRDLNKDGRIDILDARLLTTRCTRSNCSTL
jgi:hypothetical protein